MVNQLSVLNSEPHSFDRNRLIKSIMVQANWTAAAVSHLELKRGWGSGLNIRVMELIETIQ